MYVYVCCLNSNELKFFHSLARLGLTNVIHNLVHQSGVDKRVLQEDCQYFKFNSYSNYKIIIMRAL